MPITRVSRVGGMPEPAHAPPAVGDDDVTNGYVPWSMSSSVPWAPSNRTRPLRSSASQTMRVVSAM